MKKIYIVLCIILTASIFSYVFYQKNPLTATVTIKGTNFYVDTAVTAREKEKGLGYREKLLPLHGMIFIYDHKEQYGFWMKGMNFPLDFIWLDGNVVVDITENVPAMQTVPLPVIKPKMSVDKVLEINAGDVQKYGIVIGDRAIFNK